MCWPPAAHRARPAGRGCALGRARAAQAFRKVKLDTAAKQELQWRAQAAVMREACHRAALLGLILGDGARRRVRGTLVFVAPLLVRCEATRGRPPRAPRAEAARAGPLSRVGAPPPVAFRARRRRGGGPGDIRAAGPGPGVSGGPRRRRRPSAWPGSRPAPGPRAAVSQEAARSGHVSLRSAAPRGTGRFPAPGACAGPCARTRRPPCRGSAGPQGANFRSRLGRGRRSPAVSLQARGQARRASQAQPALSPLCKASLQGLCHSADPFPAPGALVRPG